MPRVHFLNVRNGDCSVIKHGSGRVSVIDVSCAFIPAEKQAVARFSAVNEAKGWQAVPGNYGQKADEDNPIEYMRKIGVSSIFRFILTHPDMDHLDGVKDLFAEFSPANFWDTANTKELSSSSFGARRKLAEDWAFYKNLRDTNPQTAPKRLVYYSGDTNDYYKTDGMSILAPTKALVEEANEEGNWNDSSYVILYRSAGRKILFAGDSEDRTWEHILANHKEKVTDLDILIAPHHGRDSGRDWEFLSVVNPKLTLFGNASSDHLAYPAWNNRGLPILTNNQAGYIILDITKEALSVYIKNETYSRNFTERNGWDTYKDEEMDAWFLGTFPSA